MADRDWLLRHEVTGWFARHGGRARSADIAAELGVSRKAVHQACEALQEQRLIFRRADQRGRVWWVPRPGSPAFVDTRKSRIVTALSRAQNLPTAQLCAAFGEHNTARGYEVLQYYREQGLIDSRDAAPGSEVRWTLHVDRAGS